MRKIIALYSKARKNRYLKKKYTTKYAFVGIGNHSMNNLYPVLRHLNVPVKYIVSRSKETARNVNSQFSKVIGTNDFEMVLQDPEISSLFICANPESHFELSMQGLSYNKNVFVEKPPCANLHELHQLEEASNKSGKIFFTGMQKRYSPCAQLLKDNLKQNGIISYSYKFATGNYPEGDEALDLFIHPLDLVSYLFGPFEIISLYNTNKDRRSNGTSVFLHLKHHGFIGNIEVSTNYSWTLCEENLMINTTAGIYRMENFDSLTFQKKQHTLFTIPLEKINPEPVRIKHLFHRNNFNPVLENNQLFTMGYYSELLNYINLCEGKKGVNLTSPKDLKPAFTLIDNIRKQHVQ